MSTRTDLEKKISCPLCNLDGEALTPRFKFTDRSIYQCRCTMRFSVPRFAQKPSEVTEKDCLAFYTHLLKVLERKKTLIYSKMNGKMKVSGKRILDFSPDQAEFAAFAQKNRWDAIGADILDRTELDVFEDGTFDYVRLFNSLDRLEHPVQMIEKCHRLLKQGGYLAVQVYDDSNLFRKIGEVLNKITGLFKSVLEETYYNSGRSCYFTLETLCTMLQFFDFSIDEFFYGIKPITQSRFKKVYNFLLKYFRLSNSITVIARKKVDIGH